ncbi:MULTISPECIES: CBS domain-containing protein [Rhodospirillales]|uniref:CBS domain protein n=2 Tax=Rhodospirillales TaxID=204441 RepID=B6IWY8_RHOCS|nr:CBS domain-containing protein [Rhodospirillum centenum]ACJ00812.1 CBS domain protein [Rhodospirillum centenum SW]
MQIRDIMTKDVELVNPGTTLKEAARKMRDADTGFLPVGENDRLVGTVTDRDITVRCVAEGADPNSAAVRDAMTDELVFVFDDQDSSEAAQLMSERSVRRLPVLNRDKRLVGVVSLGDVAARGRDEDVVGLTHGDIAKAPPNG